MGREYAFLQLYQSVYAMVHSLYVENKIPYAFYTDLMPKYIDAWSRTLEYRGALQTSPGARKYVFAAPGVAEGRRMYFLMGDHVYNRLSENEVLRHELSEMMFDLIANKAEPTIPPTVFADGDRIVNLFTLKFEETP
ncbi:hypothetical protein D3C76_25550 [compost metagenome]